MATTPDQLCSDMLALVKRFKSVMADIAEAHGLTPIQLGALHAINEYGATMGKLAQTLHCDASNVTGIVDRLTVLELVNRQEDPNDRRVKTLQLTTRGHAVLQEIITLLPSRLGCDRLNSMERDDLHHMFDRLVRET
jgi:DNA-binding MarR family transcriptional regulator